MNLHQKSIGIYFPVLVLVLGLQGCSHSGSGPTAKEDLPDELSLKSDRSELDNLRKEVPEELRGKNDELAFIMKFMGEVKESPQNIRERWNREMRKRRDMSNEILRKERETFTKNEQKKREAFLKEAESQRGSFQNGIHKNEERRDFYARLDSERKEFFANERDKRQEFESSSREKRRDFDAYLREKQSEFDQEYRSYSPRYYDLQKQLKEKAKLKADQEREKKRLENGGNYSGDSAGAPGSPGAGSAAGSEDPLTKGNRIQMEADE